MSSDIGKFFQRKLTLPRQEKNCLPAKFLIMKLKIAAITAFLLFCFALPRCFAWQTMESDNFLLHFREEDAALANEVLRRAEQVHRLVIPFYHFFPSEKTELVLNTQTDLFNGAASVFPRNRIVLDLATEPAPGGVSDSIFYLLVHEYTHILQMDQNRGPAGMLRGLFGKAPSYLTLPAAFAPLWFIEGYAIYQESKFSSGGRANSPEYTALIMAEASSDRFFSPDRLSGYFSRQTWPSLQNFAYLYGAQFISYLAAEYGEEKLLELVWELGEPHLDFKLAFSEVYGSSLEELWREWRLALGSPPREEAVWLTESGGNTIWPQRSLHDDLYYVTSQGSYVPSVRVRMKDGVDKQLLFGQLDSPAVPSADGKYLVYAKADYVNPDSIFTDLYCYDLAAQNERRLTQGLRATDPVWGKDGTVYYVRRQGQSTSVEARDPAGKVRVLLPATEGVRYSSPRLCPAEKKMALLVWREGGFQDLALFDLKVGSLDYLTEDLAIESAPGWWGKWLLYTSDLSGVEQIYATDGRSHFQVTNLPAGARQPAPHGDELTFVSLSARGYDLASMKLEERSWKKIERTKEKYAPPVKEQSSFAASSYDSLRSASPRYWLPVADLFWDPRANGLALENFRGFKTGGSDALNTISWNLGAFWEVVPVSKANVELSVLKKFGFAETLLSATGDSLGAGSYAVAAQYPIAAKLNSNFHLTGQLSHDSTAEQGKIGLAFNSLSGRDSRYDLWQAQGALGYKRRQALGSTIAEAAFSWQGLWLDSFKFNFTLQGAFSKLPSENKHPVTGFADLAGANAVLTRGEVERTLVTIQRGYYFPIDSLKARLFAEFGSAWERLPDWKRSFGVELGLSTGLGELVAGLVYPQGKAPEAYFELRNQ